MVEVGRCGHEVGLIQGSVWRVGHGAGLLLLLVVVVALRRHENYLAVGEPELEGLMLLLLVLNRLRG